MTIGLLVVCLLDDSCFGVWGGGRLKNKLHRDLPVYFYNFGWEDYGVANHGAILDIMKVMVFAMHEGKVAVHCHAGLGRTGAEILRQIVESYSVV